MSTPVLILDTSVIVSALRSRLGASFRLVELIGVGRFEIGLSVPLVFEYESVCKRLIGPFPITAEDINRILDYFCLVGKKSVVRFGVRPALADPGDEMVLEAAIASGSSWIVTHNLRDIAPGSGRFGIEAITPAEALIRLGVKR